MLTKTLRCICLMYKVIRSSTFTSFQSNWNIGTIKILSSYKCYLAPMQVIKVIQTLPWLRYYATQNKVIHIYIYMLLLLFLPLSGRHQNVDYSATLIILPLMSNVQGDTFWTSSSSTGGSKWWKGHVHKWPIG